MSVKVLITRTVPGNKGDRPDVFLVISTWESAEDWEKWLLSKERQAIQAEIDALLGGNTRYEMFHYGFRG
ncbi:MAG: antibiotic biosynthesis monooxygenase [Desulfosarcina sp.]|nr:antibiotic biosynthesis monooxygenase [Desulfosarcina sp.]